MATRATTSFRVNERGIQSLLHGDIGDFVDDVNEDAYRSARRSVPVGTGELLASIKNEGVTFTRLGATGSISATAPYVGAVIGGTGGASRIYGGGGKNHPIGAAMIRRNVPFGQVNRRPGKSGRRPHLMFARKFRGQEANNFLARALERAMVRHGIPGATRTIIEDI